MRDRFRNPHSETCTERSRSIRNRTTILNVDDDEASRYAVSRILRQAGFEVMEAANGAEALRLVKENPDLIILDVNLPDMSGFEVCWRIKADPATALIPVLHLTATYRDSQSMVMGLDGGADGYLTHPVEPPVLVSTVKAFLRIRQAEAELQAAAREWRTTFDAIGDAVCLLDLEGRILRCNEAMTNLLGKPFDKIIGRTCWELVHGTSEPIAGCPVVRMRESRRRESLVLPMGGRWLEVVVDPLLDEDDNLIGAVHIVSDITERKRAEEALWESEERLRRLFDTMSEGVVLIAPDGQITQANPAAERILGLQRSEIESRNYVGPEWEILRPDGTPMPPDEMAGPRAMKEKRLMENVVMGVRWPDGSISWINVNAAPLITESGEFEGVVGTFADITERKRAEEELQRSLETLRRTLEGTVNVLVSAIELRDPYTAGHQRGVTQLACAIANELGLSEEQIEGLRMAGLIHDVGKISIPAEILNKPGRLSDLEYGLIKAHPQVGHDILKAVEFPWPVAEITLQHHERINGSGYPQGLSGEEILLEARILAVADVVEAMASHRPYRPPRGLDEALEEISQNRVVLYDPEAVDACLKLFTEDGFTLE